MERSIIIVGAGMGGLASGVYGRANGYRTTIFEQHSVPGGQCASWKRKGYTFDACIHHLYGCDEGSGLNRLWRELGAMPRELAPTLECASVAAPDGILFRDYYDLDRLREHMMSIAPEDHAVIDEYLAAIRVFLGPDFFDEAMAGTRLGLLKTAPVALRAARWFRPTMADYGGKFCNPFFKRAFPLLVYSAPETPFFLQLVRQAYGVKGAVAWPVGASLAFARSIEKRYLDMGGKVHYKQPVERILTVGGKAVGVRLADGSEHTADVVISNADGRRTLFDLLGGRYADDRTRRMAAEPDDEAPWAVHVFLGVDRDLSDEPSSLVQLLDRKETIANHTSDHLEMQIYGFDPTMAPEGKGVIKVELVSQYSYWKRLYADRARYDEAKQQVADQVIGILDATRFPGIKGQVEVVDVPTLMTWERYVGGTHGFLSAPAKDFSPMDLLFGKGYFVPPGLADCYLVGSWATAIGALFVNALSGRKTIKRICAADGRQFIAPA